MSHNAPQHGLILQSTSRRKPLREGQHHVLAATRVRITGVQDTTLGALDRDDARLLGHRTLTAWRVHWLLTKDEDWSKKQHRDLDEQLQRFTTRWARIDVQLVRYGCEHAIVELFDVVALMQISDYENGSDAMYVRDETPVAVLRQAIRAEAA